MALPQIQNPQAKRPGPFSDTPDATPTAVPGAAPAAAVPRLTAPNMPNQPTMLPAR